MQDVVKPETLFKISVFETDILWISFYGSIHIRLRLCHTSHHCDYCREEAAIFFVLCSEKDKYW